MSKTALNEFKRAREDQLTRNDARRIRTRVEAAQNAAVTGRRWPFELIQNAHDAGPRDGDERVEIIFRLLDDNLVVSHTGKPFSAQELAALLSGGSSKEFDDEETTGRFGTGFLATHSLATRVDVKGVIETHEGFEQFQLELDRGGDEDSIIANIEQAAKSVDKAIEIPMQSLVDQPTAIFTYFDADSSVVRSGFEYLEAVLPYLYGTCDKLGCVAVESSDRKVHFAPGRRSEEHRDGFAIEATEVDIANSEEARRFSVVRMSKEGTGSALLVVLNDSDGSSAKPMLPDEGFSRLFVRFPVAQTSSLPFNVVIDGRFVPSQERDGIAMNAADRNLIDTALSALPTLITYAVEKGWRNAHQLASIAVPERALGGENATDETHWWKKIILATSQAIAAQPIIDTATGLLPAISAGSEDVASFLTPAIGKDASQLVDYERIHDIALAINGLHIPKISVAQDWQKIAKQWEDNGVPVNRLGFKELTDWTKEKANAVDDLPVDPDPYEWLAQLFLLGADLKDRNAEDMINGLLPDQYGKFLNTNEYYLYNDAGVDEEVKAIADMVSIDLKSQLLHSCITEELKAPGFESAKELVWRLLDKLDGENDYTESDALTKVLEQLSEVLQDGREFNEDSDVRPLRASAHLVEYLWESGHQQQLRQCPLLTSEGKLVRLTSSQQILAPVLRWPVSAQPYAQLYTERRVLSDRYCEDDTISGALSPLVAAGLVIEAPLYKAVRPEIDDSNLLNAMSHGALTMPSVTVRNEAFGQIAFLSTDLVSRCGQNSELARLLLDFVLTVAAREDSSWREAKEVEGHRSGERVSLSLHGATWPFELKVRSWVPVQIPDGEGFQPMPANESNLRDILDPAWLRDNPDAVDLLHKVFGFRQLTLLIDSLDAEIENDLVALLRDPDLVKSAVENPDAVKFASDLTSSAVQLDSIRTFVRDAEDDEGLIEHLAKRREQRRIVDKNQRLGYCVEGLVKENLEKAGFSVRRTGVGSDFEIAAELGDLANLKLTRGNQSWLVEVKSTREQKVKMTDTQAKEAVKDNDRFLLCVVPMEDENALPDLDEVRVNMLFIQNIGIRLEALCDDLGEFEVRRDKITAGEDAGVQLEIATAPARIRVASSVWENDGFGLEDLAKRLSS